jgi:hypothetical protein
MFSLFAAMAPSFMAQMLPWHGPGRLGLSIGVILFLSAGISSSPGPPHQALIIIGFFALAATNALLVLNLFAGSPCCCAVRALSWATGLCNLRAWPWSTRSQARQPHRPAVHLSGRGLCRHHRPHPGHGLAVRP